MLDSLGIKVFADVAGIEEIRRLRDNPLVAGFTSNPTLLNKAGVTDYRAFGIEAASLVGSHPLSLSVIADDLPTMESQAQEISGWGGSVNVKIPVMNTRGESCVDLIGRLSGQGIRVNVTAIFSHEQLESVVDVLPQDAPVILSVFAGRIADAGVDPEAHMTKARDIVRRHPTAQLLWASSREVYNVVQANRVGCDIITVTPDLMAKLSNLGKDLHQYSLETVRMFHESAVDSGYSIKD